jgi:PAS domain S-box-containing protein
MRIPARAALIAYVIAVAVVAAALGLTLAAWSLLAPAPMSLFYAAVAVAAWRGGLGPGLVATALAALAGEAMLQPSAGGGSLIAWLRVAVFAFVGATISALCAGRRRAEDARRRSEAQLTAILDRTSAVVYLKDLEGRYLFLNRRFETLFHLRRADAQHRTSHDLFPPELADRFRANDRRALAAGGPVEFEETVPHDDGLHTYISIKFPIADAAGVPYAVCGISTDITERKRAQEAVASHREWLRVTLGSIGDAVIATDAGGRVSFLNAVAEQLTGWTEEAAQGQPLAAVLTILHEERRTPVDSPVERVLREGAIVGLANQTLLVARDGTETPIDDSAAPIRDAAGAVVGVVLVFRDVSGRRRGERLERRGRERAAFLAEAGRALAASLDVAETVETIGHLAVPALADWSAIHLVEPDSGPRRVSPPHAEPGAGPAPIDPRLAEIVAGSRASRLAETLATGQTRLVPEVTEAWLRDVARDEDELQWLRAAGLTAVMHVPLASRGRVIGALTLVRRDAARPYAADDVALAEELARRAALALDNARLFRDAEAANRAKDEFLATLSHELRTPLTAVMGWVRMLRTGPLDAVAAERALATIERNTRLQAQLIEDLLDVSRIITGKLRLELRPVDLAAVTEAAVDAVRATAEVKGVDLVSRLDHRTGLVAGDPDRLQQVVWNLVSNAIKFTPRGGRVEVTLEGLDTHVRLGVTDTGRGIAPELLPYVFERFRQADGSSARAHGGLGLGLAIVRHLVDVHGGTVAAFSAGEGHGSRFVVDLPPLAARDDRSETGRVDEAGRAPIAARALEGLEVLIVDDEADARELLATILERAGARVHAAASVSEALQALDRAHPQVLVSDLGLPGEDGHDLIRRVRARDAAAGGRIPALALTAYARAEERRAALLAGFQMHMAKPLEPAELVMAVVRLAQRGPAAATRAC